MRTFPECGKESLKFENIFSLRYSCTSCNAICTSSTAQKAISIIIINLVSLLGIALGIIFKHGIVVVLSTVALTIALGWLHQRSVKLHVIAHGG